MRTTSRALGAMAMLLVLPAAVHAADEWQVGMAPNFSSGRYGTDSRTEVLHTPITARRLFANADLTLVFPLTCIWGSAGVTVVNGLPVRTERLQAAAPTSPTPTTRGDTTTTRTGTTTSTTRTDAATETTTSTIASSPISTCGLGDIVVRGRFYVVEERAWIPSIAIRAHVKTPTADAERGLGTGRPDEGIGVEVSRTFGRGQVAMLDAGYTLIGRPEGVEYNNNWWYDLGFGQDLGGEAVNLSVFFSERRAIVPGLDNARDVLVALNLKGTTGWRVQIAGEKGLSDGSPDHGITIGASRRF